MLLGISGKINSGKSTLAEMVHERLPDYDRVAFADVLKKTAALLTGDIRQWDHEGKNRTNLFGITNGQLQQRLAGLREIIHPDVYVLACLSGRVNAIVSDCRYPNEARYIKARGGLLVRLLGSRTGPGSRDPNHESETALDGWQDWDFVFDNTVATLDDLGFLADNIATVVKLRG